MEKGKPHSGMGWNLLVAVALIFVTVAVEGQRPRPPPPNPPPTQMSYEWMRDVGGDTNIAESAGVVEDRNIVVFRSVDSNLQSANMTNAVIVYDFNAPNGGVGGVRLLQGPRICFLVPVVNSTFNSTSELVESYNGTVVTADTNEAFDGTGRALPGRLTYRLYRRNPALRRHCRFSRLVRVQPISGDPPADARELQIPDVDRVLSLYVRAPPTSPLGFLDRA